MSPTAGQKPTIRWQRWKEESGGDGKQTRQSESRQRGRRGYRWGGRERWGKAGALGSVANKAGRQKEPRLPSTAINWMPAHFRIGTPASVPRKMNGHSCGGLQRAQTDVKRSAASAVRRARRTAFFHAQVVATESELDSRTSQRGKQHPATYFDSALECSGQVGPPSSPSKLLSPSRAKAKAVAFLTLQFPLSASCLICKPKSGLTSHPQSGRGGLASAVQLAAPTTPAVLHVERRGRGSEA